MNAATVAVEADFARRRPNRWLLGVAFLALAGLAFLLLRGGAEAGSGAPHATDRAELGELSRRLDQPIFWAGPANPGDTLELTRSVEGSVFVRYLPAGASPGDARDRFTTVATYSVPGAFAALERQAKAATVVSRELPNGGLATLDVRRPHSVHLAWPGLGYEVELFDSSPRRALQMVLDGTVTPVR